MKKENVVCEMVPIFSASVCCTVCVYEEFCVLLIGWRSSQISIRFVLEWIFNQMFFLYTQSLYVPDDHLQLFSMDAFCIHMHYHPYQPKPK